MIAESLHAGIPVLNASPVLNNQLQPTAEALVDFQEAPGVFNGLDLLIDTNQAAEALAAPTSPRPDRLQLLDAHLQIPRQRQQPGQRPRQLAQLHLLRSAGRAEQRERLRQRPRERRSGGPEKPKTTSTSTRIPKTAAPGQGNVCEAGNEKYAKGKTVIGNAPELWGTTTRGAGRQKMSRLPERDRRAAEAGTGRFKWRPSNVTIAIIFILIFTVGPYLAFTKHVPVHQLRLRSQGDLLQLGQHRAQLAGADRRRRRRQSDRDRTRRRRDQGHLHRRRLRPADPRRRLRRDPAADLPRGQLLHRTRPRQPQRAGAWTAATRSRSATPRPRSRSTKS